MFPWRMTLFGWCGTIFPFNGQTLLHTLGLFLPWHIWQVYGTNYLPLIKILTLLLESWNKSHISWLGQIYAVNMTLLPKLLYLFRVLLVPVPLHILRSLQHFPFKLIWGSVKSRLNRYLLYKPMTHRGLGMSNIIYYKAAQIAPLAKLLQVTLLPSGPLLR